MATPPISNSSQQDMLVSKAFDGRNEEVINNLSQSTQDISPTSICTLQANASGIDRTKHMKKPEYFDPTLNPHYMHQLYDTRLIIHSIRSKGTDAKALCTSEDFRIQCKSFLDFVTKNHFENSKPPEIKLIKNFGPIFTDAGLDQIIRNSTTNEDIESNSASRSLPKGKKSKSTSASYSGPKTTTTSQLSDLSSPQSTENATHLRDESTFASDGLAANFIGEFPQDQPMLNVTIKSGGKKKRNRIVRDYFNSNRKNAKMYSLIRHSFSSEYDREFLQKPESKEIVNECIDSCRNVTNRVKSEGGWKDPCKILLISQNAIRKAKQMVRKFRPPTTCNNDDKEEFQTYMFNGSIKHLKAIYEDKFISLIDPNRYKPKYGQLTYEEEKHKIKEPITHVSLDHGYLSTCTPLCCADILMANARAKDLMKSLNNFTYPTRPIPVPSERIETEIVFDDNLMERPYMKRYKMNLQEDIPVPEFDFDSLMNIPRKLNREKCLQQNPTIDSNCDDEKNDFVAKSLLKLSHTLPVMPKQTLINDKYKMHSQLLSIFDQHNENILDPEYLELFERLIYLINHGTDLSNKKIKTPFEEKLLSFIRVYLLENHTVPTLTTEMLCYVKRSLDFVRKGKKDPNIMQQQEQYWQERDDFKEMGFDDHQIVELMRANRQNDRTALNRLIHTYMISKSRNIKFST